MINAKAGAGKYQVEASAFRTEDGLIIHLLGGELPHVGAIVFSIPRESLTGDGSPSCTTSSLPFVGHKDDLAVKNLVEELSILTGQKVVAISGIHIDEATEEDIKILQNNVAQVSREILNTFK